VLREDGVEVAPEASEKVWESMEFATAASLKSYMEAHDRAVRKAQAEQVGFIVHELRGPLAAAAMSAEVLRRMGVPSKQHLQTLDRLHLNFQRASRLTEELLHVGYLESGRATCRLLDTTIGRIIDDLVEDGRQAAQAKGCMLSADYDPALRVVADSELTRKAVESLLDNAVKYTDRGSIRLVVTQTCTGTSIHVRDSCMGIPEDELAVIFEPFRRGNNGKPGTGLGLTIARRAMEAQAGSLSAESVNGGGCHFWITLLNRHES
jgi:signal transduction histidine kinase